VGADRRRSDGSAGPRAVRARRWRIALEGAETRAVVEPATAGRAGAGARLAVLAHGAGGHMEHAHTLRLTRLLRGCGLDVARFDFGYRARGSGPPDRMPALVACYAAVVDRAREAFEPERLLLCGHSMGGRVATVMAADGHACDGLVLFGYPLHPPRRPTELRDAHLARIARPVLCFNGTRDALCTRAPMERTVAALAPRWTQHWVAGADHSMAVPKRSGRTPDDVDAELAGALRTWLAAGPGRRRRRP